jgi:alanyl-tRNA synthetase
MVTRDLTDKIQANKIIRPIASVIQGGGGGRPDLAEAGGKNPRALPEALEKTYQVIDETLS